MLASLTREYNSLFDRYEKSKMDVLSFRVEIRQSFSGMLQLVGDDELLTRQSASLVDLLKSRHNKLMDFQKEITALEAQLILGNSTFEAKKLENNKRMVEMKESLKLKQRKAEDSTNRKAELIRERSIEYNRYSEIEKQMNQSKEKRDIATGSAVGLGVATALGLLTSLVLPPVGILAAVGASAGGLVAGGIAVACNGDFEASKKKLGMLDSSIKGITEDISRTEEEICAGESWIGETSLELARIEAQIREVNGWIDGCKTMKEETNALVTNIDQWIIILGKLTTRAKRIHNNIDLSQQTLTNAIEDFKRNFLQENELLSLTE